MTSLTTSKTNQEASSGIYLDTPLSDEALKLFPEFMSKVAARLDVGRSTYGDNSFERPDEEVIDEIMQELLDLSGWAFIRYARLKRILSKPPR